MDKIINIIHGDCLTELKAINDNSVDLIIADPPYNIGKDYGNKSDKQDFDSYLNFTKSWLTECKRIMKESGTIYVFAGFRYISYIYQILERELEMNFINWISWHYTQGIGKTKGFSPRHDDILAFSKSDKYKFNLDAIRIPQKFYRKANNMRGANPGDVWEVSHIHYCQKERQPHPTQKPEALIERIVLASSDEGDFVVDPFSGSGTTLRVCQQLKRNALGIELNKEYVKQTKERLSSPFVGFDSIDERMLRVPKDLNDTKIRREYIKNHINWFLKNHPNRIKTFLDDVKTIYSKKNEETQIEFIFPDFII
ncbi:MAG: site-specific DNA-methyltransferase [Prevotellaceae bacterium]|nr:site-specific DNA-methyltransferase [Prevotellaceae bacterium]